MYFSGLVRIITGDYKEFYIVDEDNYSIGDPEDYPPKDYLFHIQIKGGKEAEIENFTSLHSFYFLKKICNNPLIDYVCDEYFSSDSVDIWII